jgi:uncharacterized membrane protein YuzA (DUF378 family)
MKNLNGLDWLFLILLIIGGLNWGLWAAFGFDLVATIFSSNTALLARIVYGLVGISAIYVLASLGKLAKK